MRLTNCLPFSAVDWLSSLTDYHPYLLLFILVSLLLICTLLIIICLVTRYKRKSRLRRKKQLPTSPSIVGIVNGMPVKSYIRNPDYSPPPPPLAPALKELPMPTYPPPPPALEDLLEEDESQEETGSSGNSVIGVDDDVEPLERDREILHYSHILPKYERPIATSGGPKKGPSVISATLPRKMDHPYLKMVSTPLPPKDFRSRKSIEDQYEIIARPLNSYENTNQSNLQVLGFSSLRRDTKSGLLRSSVPNLCPVKPPPVAPKPPLPPVLQSQGATDSLSQNSSSDSGVDSDK